MSEKLIRDENEEGNGRVIGPCVQPFLAFNTNTGSDLTPEIIAVQEKCIARFGLHGSRHEKETRIIDILLEPCEPIRA